MIFYMKIFIINMKINNSSFKKNKKDKNYNSLPLYISTSYIGIDNNANY